MITSPFVISLTIYLLYLRQVRTSLLFVSYENTGFLFYLLEVGTSIMFLFAFSLPAGSISHKGSSVPNDGEVEP